VFNISIEDVQIDFFVKEFVFIIIVNLINFIDFYYNDIDLFNFNSYNY
jgi:hypothetical protein